MKASTLSRGASAGKCTVRSLIARLWALREEAVAAENAASSQMNRVDRRWRASARNLVHYLSLRRHDLRHVQECLARLGLSSLGRAEPDVLANLDKVIGILHLIDGTRWRDRSAEEPVGLRHSRRLLGGHARDLLGEPPASRDVRVMVTLPSEAARSARLVRDLVTAGMDVARINCAHDGPEEWEAMVRLVREAGRGNGRPVRVLMDLSGPKLRIGCLPAGPAVLKLKPVRDELGQVLAPATLRLVPVGITQEVAPQTAAVDGRWLARLRVGDCLDFTDARGAPRALRVTARQAAGVLAQVSKTAYLTSDTNLSLRRGGKGSQDTRTTVAARPGALTVHVGDLLQVVADSSVRVGQPDVVPCTLPEVFSFVRKGERIFFDDGRVAGIVRRATEAGLEIEVTEAREKGDRLRSGSGINLPDSRIDLPALTGADIENLRVVTAIADAVGLSFVQSADDVRTLRAHLKDLGAEHLGIVLKVETKRAFENLPELLLEAMGGPCAGLMIARGDLAVECGFERLAEIQEELLWAAEAAHIPVIWATQVLENLAKTGRPSRAEITDAAMSARAECVMLNKGPHIVAATAALDDILRRMRAHQAKKRTLLRALTAWSQALDQSPASVGAPRSSPPSVGA